MFKSILFWLAGEVSWLAVEVLSPCWKDFWNKVSLLLQDLGSLRFWIVQKYLWHKNVCFCQTFCSHRHWSQVKSLIKRICKTKHRHSYLEHVSHSVINIYIFHGFDIFQHSSSFLTFEPWISLSLKVIKTNLDRQETKYVYFMSKISKYILKCIK